MARHTLSVLVNNHMGVLSRVSGLFSRRAFSINSLSSGTTENKDVARMTIELDCDNDEFDQIKNQLSKLMDVIAISEMTDDEAVKRELALIKIDCNSKTRRSILDIVEIYRAHVIDAANDSMTIELTGDKSKITAMIHMLDEYGVREIIRTGVIAIQRGKKELKDEGE